MVGKEVREGAMAGELLPLLAGCSHLGAAALAGSARALRVGSGRPGGHRLGGYRSQQHRDSRTDPALHPLRCTSRTTAAVRLDRQRKAHDRTGRVAGK